MFDRRSVTALACASGIHPWAWAPSVYKYSSVSEQRMFSAPKAQDFFRTKTAQQTVMLYAAVANLNVPVTRLGNML